MTRPTATRGDVIIIYSLLATATLLLAALTLLPILRHEAWWIRGLDFPRLQFSVLALIILALDLVALDLTRPSTWGLVAVAALCLAYQSWWIIPYTGLHSVEVKSAREVNDERTLRIMTANVLMSNHNSDALIKLVRENVPDILVTLESDSWWQTRLEPLETEYTYTIKCPLDNLYGMHVYSKLPLTETQIEFLVESDIPSMHALVTLTSVHKVRMHFLHPAPPSPTENKESSERDAELLLVAKSIAETNEPIIVTGDLNDVAWSETTRLFRKISNLLDPRIGRGMFNTYHADYWFLRWPLDHLFHSDHFTLRAIHRLHGFGSDHFALFTELVYEADRKHEHSGLDADSDDLTWANEKLKSQNVEKKHVPTPGKH